MTLWIEIKTNMKIKHNIIFIMKLPVNNTEPFHKTVSSIYKIHYNNLVARNNLGLFIKFYTAFDNKLLRTCYKTDQWS